MHIHPTVSELVPPMLHEMTPCRSGTLLNPAARCRAEQELSYAGFET